MQSPVKSVCISLFVRKLTLALFEGFCLFVFCFSFLILCFLLGGFWCTFVVIVSGAVVVDQQAFGGFKPSIQKTVIHHPSVELATSQLLMLGLDPAQVPDQAYFHWSNNLRLPKVRFLSFFIFLSE